MIGLSILGETFMKYPNWQLQTEVPFLLFLFSPLVGIILGIIACVLARFDLKQVSEEPSGLIQRRAYRMGLVFGATGIIFAPICFVVALSHYASASVVANKDAIRKDLMNIASHAYQYRNRPENMEGGGGSYLGFTLPKKQRDNENGTYEISVQSGDTLIILATSAGYPLTTLTAVLIANGKIVRSIYSGDFSP